MAIGSPKKLAPHSFSMANYARKWMGYSVLRCKTDCNTVRDCPVYKALKARLDREEFTQFSSGLSSTMLPNTVELRATYRPDEPFMRTDIYLTKKLSDSTLVREEEPERVCDFMVELSEGTWKVADFEAFVKELRQVMVAEVDKLERKQG